MVKVWSVPEQDTEFDPQKIEDTRKKITASIVQRQGQKEFRHFRVSFTTVDKNPS